MAAIYDSEELATALTSFSFPRTGKRGVPQQFPRRLYEMLEKETELLSSVSTSTTSASCSYHRVISWSDSGNAFRIWDVSGFANTVLPKYFRTSKFSSFQRNLNLYGFCKVRRGPEQDMYTHPHFRRNDPEGLLQLRKISNRSKNNIINNHTRNSTAHKILNPLAAATRAAMAAAIKTRTTSAVVGTRAISPSGSSSLTSPPPPSSSSSSSSLSSSSSSTSSQAQVQEPQPRQVSWVNKNNEAAAAANNNNNPLMSPLVLGDVTFSSQHVVWSHHPSYNTTTTSLLPTSTSVIVAAVNTPEIPVRSLQKQQMPTPTNKRTTTTTTSPSFADSKGITPSCESCDDRGRLDLLTFALEQEEEGAYASTTPSLFCS